MKHRKIYLLIFLFVLLCLSAGLVWNSYRAYTYEKNQVAKEVDVIVSKVATQIQAENITLINNSARMLTDKEIHEKIAFAAGFTRNEGKMSVTFGEDEKEVKEHERKLDAQANKPVHIDKQFIVEHNLKFDEQQLKGLAVFDSIFRQEMNVRELQLPFTVSKSVRREERMKGSFYSEPFIFDFFDPVMYRMKFDIPTSVVLKRILPEIITSACILLLLIGAFTFFYRSYKLQLQMYSFKESLFSNVTHELKSPLTSLGLIIDEAGEGQPLSPEHWDYAQKELNRMSLLIEKILSFGKMTKEQIEMNKTLVDVVGAVSDAVGIQEMIIKRVNGIVHLDMEQKEEVYADKALLTNVFITLLDNSLKYNNGYPEITVNVRSLDKMVAISIADNGIGMNGVFLNRIFDPFFRIPDNDTHNVKGHGLGLSFVKQVVDMHGGSVTVDSTLGKGSCFVIKLPKA